MLAALPLGVTVAGEKLQEPPAGKPPQAKVTDWLKPPDANTDRAKGLDCPGLSVADCGATDTAKSGEAALTPVPVRPTCCAEPLALSLMIICAEREPEVVGVKTTLIAQFAPAVKEPEHVLV